MKVENILVIGTGQCGTTIATQFVEQFNYDKNNLLLFNSAKDSLADDHAVILTDSLGGSEGSARNPSVTFNSIIPNNEAIIRKAVTAKINNDIKQVIVFCSLGGGTGSALTYWLMKEVLISMNETFPFATTLVLVGPFKSEGNPCNSNALVMLRMFNTLSNKVSVLPIFNDYVHIGGGRTLFEKTNEYICQQVNSTINFEAFAGKKKDMAGLSSLDKNEFLRVLKPVGGFLTRVSVNYQTIESMDKLTDEKFIAHFDPRVNKFDIRTAKSLVVMFRTVKGKNISMEVMNKIHAMFPEQLKIFAESEAFEPPQTIEFLANGIDLPESFMEGHAATVNAVDRLKEIKKEARRENKDKLSVVSKRLFRL